MNGNALSFPFKATILQLRYCNENGAVCSNIPAVPKHGFLLISSAASKAVNNYLTGRDSRAAKPILYLIFSLLLDSFSLMPEHAPCFDHLHENSFHILNSLDPVFSF